MDPNPPAAVTLCREALTAAGGINRNSPDLGTKGATDDLKGVGNINFGVSVFRVVPWETVTRRDYCASCKLLSTNAMHNVQDGGKA
jgi:hypothetical protein